MSRGGSRLQVMAIWPNTSCSQQSGGTARISTGSSDSEDSSDQMSPVYCQRTRTLSAQHHRRRARTCPRHLTRHHQQNATISLSLSPGVCCGSEPLPAGPQRSHPHFPQPVLPSGQPPLSISPFSTWQRNRELFPRLATPPASQTSTPRVRSPHLSPSLQAACHQCDASLQPLSPSPSLSPSMEYIS